MPTIGTELNNVESAIRSAAFGLEQIPFVDFTTTLIREVIQTLVDSSIEQMEAYADLVATLSNGLVDYQNKLVGGSPPERLAIAESYLQTILGTTTLADPVQVDETLHSNLLDLFSLIFIEEAIDNTGAGIALPTGLDADSNGKLFFDELTVPTSGTPTNVSLDVMRSFAIEKIKSQAKISYDKLETILRMGLNRVVAKNVTIESKLTFHIDSSELQSADETTTDTSFSENSTEWSVNAFFAASGTLKDGKSKANKKLASGIVNRSYGGHISGGIRSGKTDSKLKVTVINEKATAATNLNIDILGHVKIEARSDYFPSYDPNNSPQ